MTSVSIASRCFSAADQRRFAELSGDHNPMHMDPLAARRTQAGVPVAHGINVLLWGLECFAIARPGKPVHRIDVRFDRFVAVGQEVRLWLDEGPARSQLEVRQGATKLIVCRIFHDPASPVDIAWMNDCTLDTEPARGAPADLSFEKVANKSGALSLPVLGADYSALSAVIGEGAVSSLASLSYLVGMVCPGLHSIFSRLDLRFQEQPAGAVLYRVNEVSDIFRFLVMDVAGPGLAGQVRAFMRMPPVEQPKTSDLLDRVMTNEFTGINALIVGGSRGLGELTAKLLAAGGAKLAISYAVGAADAASVAADIRAAGGECVTVPIDVLQPLADQVEALPFKPNQVYYFATSKIFLQKDELYEPDLLTSFRRIYVDGFYDLCRTLSERATTPVTVYYPSSIGIDDRPRNMTEYVMAKAAAELLCADINRFMPNISVHVTRLPRLATDQTVSIVSVETEDAVSVMASVIRAMTARSEPRK